MVPARAATGRWPTSCASPSRLPSPAAGPWGYRDPIVGMMRGWRRGLPSMTEIVRRMTWDRQYPLDPDSLLTHEWLVTNGLGGSASGTVAGVATRRFHGLLVAALPAPLGRIVMLNHLAEQLRLPDGRLIEFGGSEYAEGDPYLPGAAHLAEFRLELGLPVWHYEGEGYQIEKRIILPHRQNTVQITYRLLAGPGP